MMMDGKLVGIAFQSLIGAENTGYIIPLPVVRTATGVTSEMAQVHITVFRPPRLSLPVQPTKGSTGFLYKTSTRYA